MVTPPVREVLDATEMGRAMTRMAHQISEIAHGGDVVLIGVQTRGVPLAQRLAATLSELSAAPPPVGVLDITMYRDDLRHHPTRAVGRTAVPFSIDDTHVVIVDDVLSTGRTVLAALEALKDLGRPAAVRLAVLVDRGHRELPVRPDVVGLDLRTARDERVRVHLTEVDGIDEVLIERDRLVEPDASTKGAER